MTTQNDRKVQQENEMVRVMLYSWDGSYSTLPAITKKRLIKKFLKKPFKLTEEVYDKENKCWVIRNQVQSDPLL